MVPPAFPPGVIGSADRELAIELEVDALEAELSVVAMEWLEARCNAHASGARAPAAPVALRSAERQLRLRELARNDVRARQLWCLCARATPAGPEDDGYARALALDDLSTTDVNAALAWAQQACAAEASSLATPLRDQLRRRLREIDPVEAAIVTLAETGLSIGNAVVSAPAVATAALPRTYLIDPPHRVEIVIAVEPTLASWRQLWHELGHAAVAAHHDPADSWAMRDTPPVVHEALAELVAAELERPATLERLLKVDSAAAEQLAHWRRGRRAHWLAGVAQLVEAERDGKRVSPARPEGHARYLVAEHLAFRVRERTTRDPRQLAALIREVAGQGARYQWKALG